MRNIIWVLVSDTDHFRDRKERVAYRARATLAVAMFADDPVYVVLGSDQSGLNPENSWNRYARPVLQARRRQMIWLDNNGRERRPMYPLDVIPPEEEIRKGHGLIMPPDEEAVKALAPKQQTLMLPQRIALPEKRARPSSESEDSGGSTGDEFHIGDRQRKART